VERGSTPLNALRAFSMVARHESFTAAASALHISQSALSRHVILLEEMLQLPLFERKNKVIKLTVAGQILLEGVNKGLSSIENALNQLGRLEGCHKQRLRINLPPSFAMKMAVPLLMDFKNNFPDCLLEVATPYGKPASDFDVAVIYARPTVDEWVTDLLWEERVMILCHPQIAPLQCQDIATLIAQNEIVHVRIVDEDPYYSWKRFAIHNNLAVSSVERGTIVDTASLAVEYILSGQGLALVDPLLFRDEMACGSIVAPFPFDHYEGYGYYLKVEATELANPLIAAFRSWLIGKFKNRVAVPKSNNNLAIVA